MAALYLATFWICSEPGYPGQKIRALAPGAKVWVFGWVRKKRGQRR